MDGACDAHRRGQRCVQVLISQNPNRRDNLQDVRVIVSVKAIWNSKPDKENILNCLSKHVAYAVRRPICNHFILYFYIK